MTNCYTGINAIQTITNECNGENVSTNCVLSPEANITLSLSAGASQTQTNAALTTALIYKEQQIQTINNSIVPVSATVSGIVNNTSLQELGGVDKLINGVRIGKGTGIINTANTVLGNSVLGLNVNGDSNTGVGYEVLKSNTDGYENTAVGTSSMTKNTTGENNTAYGAKSMYNNIDGFGNTAIGDEALYNNISSARNVAIGSSAQRSSTSGNDNVSIGYVSGNYASDGITSITTIGTSVMLGNNTKPLANAQTNQIVIGYNAIGAGTNTATLGNTSITKTILRGTINVANLAIFADNTAAITGGLIAGDMYRTATGDLKVRY